MGIDELEQRIAEIRAKPLLLICQMPSGKHSLTIRECWESRSRFVHVNCDEIDKVLGASLGGDNERV